MERALQKILVVGGNGFVGVFAKHARFGALADSWQAPLCAKLLSLEGTK